MKDKSGPFDPTRSGRLPCLDGLRAAAIGMVIFAHAGPSMEAAGILRLHGALKAIFHDSLGSLGVTLFFGLSGYLITHLLVRERRARGGISLRQFYLRRVLRIFPALYLYLGAIALCTLFGILAVRGRDILSAGAFLMNYLPIDTDRLKPGWFVGHTWSLALEEQFYLFWPLTLAAAGLRRARVAALALIVLMPLIRIGLYFQFPAARPTLGYQIHECADRMMYGSLLALLDGDARFERFMAWASPMMVPALLLGFIVFIDPLLQARYHGTYYLTAGIPIESVTFAFLIGWLLRHAGSWPARMLDLRPLAFIGTLSYSLYLWQQPFTSPANSTFSGLFPLNVLCAFLCALGSYYLIERRFLKLRDRFRTS